MKEYSRMTYICFQKSQYSITSVLMGHTKNPGQTILLHLIVKSNDPFAAHCLLKGNYVGALGALDIKCIEHLTLYLLFSRDCLNSGLEGKT